MQRAGGRPPALATTLRFGRLGTLRLPRDHRIRFPNGTAFVTGSFQALVGYFRPKLFQVRRARLVRMPSRIIRSPRRRKSPFNGLAGGGRGC